MSFDNFFLLALFAASALTACSPKTTDVEVQDPGPKFKVQLGRQTLTATSGASIVIRREDPSSGPQVNLNGPDEQNIATVKKTLDCGTQHLNGRPASQGDWDLTNFRISEEEFPGLALLPLQADCKLTINATNNLSSTYGITLPIKLIFDTPPVLPVSRLVAVEGLNHINNRFEIPLEMYRLKNTLPYTAGFIFKPHRVVVGLPHFKYQKVGVQPGPGTSWDDYVNKPETLTATRIEITGDISGQTGEMTHEVYFSVPKDGTVTVVSYAAVPVNLVGDVEANCQSFSYFPITGTCERSFDGIYVTTVQSVPSLAQLRGFDKTSDDEKDPSYFTFPALETPIPGITVDHSLSTKIF